MTTTGEDPRIARTLEYVERSLDGLLKRPLMWGPPEAIETAFDILLEIKHGIEHVDCKERCAWNCVVNYHAKVLGINCMLWSVLKEKYPAEKGKYPTKALHVMTEHLSAIRQLYGKKHPIPWRYEFNDGTVWTEDKSIPAEVHGAIQINTVKEERA